MTEKAAEEAKEGKREEPTDWTAEDEKTLNNLLEVIKNSNKIIEDAQKRMAEIDVEMAEAEKAKIGEGEKEIIKPETPEKEENEKEIKPEGKGLEIKKVKDIESKKGVLKEKSGIPIATEVFNEKRSIKDVSGKEITMGDIVTDQSNRDWLVCGFFERKIAERYLKPGEKDFILYANLAEYENGEPNFNTRSSASDGERALKEKWQPKYRNGEIIKIGDIVKANVEKFMFEIYNKKLKVIGFNLDGRVSVEVLDNGGDKEVALPSVLEIFYEEEEKVVKAQQEEIEAKRQTPGVRKESKERVVMWAGVPNEDGTWSNDRMKRGFSGKMFKFFITGKLADITIPDEESHFVLIKDKDIYLKPISEQPIITREDATLKRIVTDGVSAQAVLEDDGLWHITRKFKLHIE